MAPPYNPIEEVAVIDSSQFEDIVNPLEEYKKKQLEALAALDQQRAEAKKAYEASQGSSGGRDIWEQLLVGLAPMALGAALGGETGIGSGALGARAGIKSYESAADRRAKEEAAISKAVFGSADKAYQKALDQIGDIGFEQAKAQSDLASDVFKGDRNAAFALQRVREPKLDKPATAADLFAAREVAARLGLPYVPDDATERATKAVLELGKQKTKEQSQSIRDIAAQRRADAAQEALELTKGKTLNKAEDEIVELGRQKLSSASGAKWLEMPRDNKKVDKVEKAIVAHEKIQSSMNDLIAVVDRNNGFAVSGSEDYQIQQTAVASLTVALKELYEMGANFTEMEGGIVRNLAAINDADKEKSIVFGWLKNKALDRSTLEGLKVARQNLRKEFGLGMLTYGVAPGGKLADYGPEVVAKALERGLPIDKATGAITVTDAIELEQQRKREALGRLGISVNSSNRSSAQPVPNPVAPKAQPQISEELLIKGTDIVIEAFKAKKGKDKTLSYDEKVSLGKRLKEMGILQDQAKELISIQEKDSGF